MMTANSWFSNLLLIGGSPCAGKSTAAHWLSERYAVPVYRCDDAYFEHGKEATTQQPVFQRLFRATGDAVWMRPVNQQIREELEIYREEFPFIIRDLEVLARTGPVIAEGAALLPSLVATLGVPRNQVIYLVPTESFQRSHYEQRDWRHDVVKDCSDRAQAWENWMARDAAFANVVADEAREHAFEIIVVDGANPVEAMLKHIRRHFEIDAFTRRTRSVS